jgi:hypothetical protein
MMRFPVASSDVATVGYDEGTPTVGTGEKVTGTLILDVPVTEGTLVFAPTFADTSLEWQYPAQ